MFICVAIIPPYSPCMALISVCKFWSAGIMPFDTISIRACCDTPLASASSRNAGIPISCNCIISSVVILPFACIWPRARLIRSTPSAPAPSAEEASPIVVINAGISFAANPIASSFCVPCAMSSKVNGVRAAKSSMTRYRSFPACVLPVIS